MINHYDWNRYLDKYPGLWHGTSIIRMPYILRQGILPFDQGMKPPIEKMARPGHVYLASHFKRAFQEGREGYREKPIVLKIDPGYLNIENINPDEDAFIHSWPKSLNRGQYASQINLGRDAEETINCLYRTRTLSYYGSIPPEAIIPFQNIEGKLEPRPKEEWDLIGMSYELKTS